MTDLDKKALGGLARFVVCLALLLFLPAWTLDYWQAWLFLAVFSTSMLATTLHLMRNDPKLLERRMNAGPAAEQDKRQKIIQTAATVAFVAVIVVSVVDHRFAWSGGVSPHVAVAGDALVALGLLIVFLVFKENTFASASIEVDADQKVVSTGPYAVVRHPMYAGALIMVTGIPPALGSWWGLLAALAMTLAIVWRLLEEERFLAENLLGYQEYRSKVPQRLLPLIW